MNWRSFYIGVTVGAGLSLIFQMMAPAPPAGQFSIDANGVYHARFN